MHKAIGISLILHQYKLHLFCLLDINCIIRVSLEYKSQNVSDDKKCNLYFRKYSSLLQDLCWPIKSFTASLQENVVITVLSCCSGAALTLFN